MRTIQLIISALADSVLEAKGLDPEGNKTEELVSEKSVEEIKEPQKEQ